VINLKTEDWEINNIETILFDKDGTFVDLHYFWGKMTELRCIEVIKEFNLDLKLLAELCLILGFDLNTQKMLSDGITAMYSRPIIIKIFKEKIEKYNVFTTEDKLTEIFDRVNTIFYKNLPIYVKPIKDAIDFIKNIRVLGIKTGIVTSDSIESTSLTIKHFNWESLFDCQIGRECSKETKESGALSALGLKELNANPKTTIMIGDTPMDYLSATNSGVEKTILVSTGQIPIEELKKTSPYVIHSLKEIEVNNVCENNLQDYPV
jgi:pyrophosphatase PpaX